MLFTKIFTFSSLLATALAAPFIAEVAEKRDVVAPKMTSPTADTVWVVGNTYKVTWDTSDLPPPANISNKIGQVVLGQFDANGDEHLQIDTPLVKDFPITSGSVDVVCPSVPAGKYFLVLFGDSGNNGPEFTITTASMSASVSPSVTATSSSLTVPSLTTETPAPSLSPSETLAPSPSTSVDDSSSAPSSVSDSLPLSLPSAPSSRSGLSSIPVPTPSGISSGSGASQSTSGASSWMRANSCLTLAVVALSAVLVA